MKFVYANLGRGNKSDVARSWASLAKAALLREVDASVVVEVDEGDKGYSDHALLRRYFTGWRLRFMQRMVVILVNPKHNPTGAKVTTASNSAVKRWSPLRYVVELVLPAKRGPDVCVIGVHYAAGYRNGTRPAAAKALLAVSWIATRLAHRSRVRAAHRRGEHSVSLFDSNDHRFDATYLHPQAVVLFGPGGSDWCVAVPAPGFEVAWSKDDRVATYVERFHQGHEVSVIFRRVGQ